MSQQINLFNPQFEQKTHQMSARTAGACLGALALGLLLLCVLGQRSLTDLQRQEADVQAALAKAEARRDQTLRDFPPRKKDPGLAQEVAAAEAQRQLLLDASAVLASGELGNTQGFAGYFRALAQARVDGVWLTSINIVGAGSELGLQGRALHASLLPAYITRLGQQDVLAGKSFSSLDIGPPPAPAATDGKAPAAPYVAFSLQSSSQLAAAAAATAGGKH